VKAIVIFRDRVTYAQQCVVALTAAGLDVHVVDHDSSWPPAVEWLATCGLPVHHRPNDHPRSLWTWDHLPRIVGTWRYVVTDPDVVPDPSCPTDWPVHLNSLLDRWPVAVKAGLGLRIDDLPDDNPDSPKVQDWEAQWWQQPLEVGAFNAAVDTTLAMYPPLNQRPHFALGPAIRTDRPYVARHLTWYETPECITDETVYYRRHATPGVSHWVDPDLYLASSQNPAN